MDRMDYQEFAPKHFPWTNMNPTPMHFLTYFHSFKVMTRLGSFVPGRRYRYPTILTILALLTTGCGGGSSATDKIAAAVSETPILALLAGDVSGPGSIDGATAIARFSYPAGIAIDGTNNIYIADSGNSTVRKISPDGVVSTIAGTTGSAGSVDGVGTAARLNFGPAGGLGVDSAGNIFVGDRSRGTIRKISPLGVVSTLRDPTGVPILVGNYGGIAIDGTGNVYLTGPDSHLIRKISLGGVLSTLAGADYQPGSADGPGTLARFNSPLGIAVDQVGNVFVADSVNRTIRMISPAGLVSTLAGTPTVTGSADGTGAGALFSYPLGLSLDSSGNVYVADGGAVRKITPMGVVTTLAGVSNIAGFLDGQGAAARLSPPSWLASETASHSIRKITPDGSVGTLAGSPWIVGKVDSTGPAARFNNPEGLAADSLGNAYVADAYNNAIRKIDPAGKVTTIAGDGIRGNSDGVGQFARFSNPQGVAVDATGNVFVADLGNHLIRKIDPAGIVSTLAGIASIAGSQDGPIGVATFNYPKNLAVDGVGNIYVADTGNSTIRRISPSGMVSTLAGTAGASGSADGIGTAASFNQPTGIAADMNGNVFVADSAGNTIRKIAPGAIVTTLAGTAGTRGSKDGIGADASFAVPYGLSTDAEGNVYVADPADGTIRKITQSGAVTTVAGVTNQIGFAPGPLPGALPTPLGVAIGKNRMYILVNHGVVVVNNYR
jgi:sugar lactone lactonase YvrE